MLVGVGDLHNKFLSTIFRDKGDDCQTLNDCFEVRSSAWLMNSAASWRQMNDKCHHKQVGVQVHPCDLVKTELTAGLLLLALSSRGLGKL